MTDGEALNPSLGDWLRLTAVAGLGGDRQRKLLQAFGLPAAIFDASPSALRAVLGPSSDKLIDALLGHVAQPAIDAALAWASQPDNRILTLADPEYPQALLTADDPPVILYAKGDLAVLQRPAIAMVGSRNATQQGAQNAEAFAEALSRAGLTVVSGLALGIDAAAHSGALRGPGGTVAVIGTGIDRIYPARNEALARQIAAQGVVLSEFPLGTPPLASNFPRRNRIIAGLAQGCLVVEAAERSGSLITARLAAESGRDVFAIPGSIHSPVARGCHKLIKQGAKLVESAQDILDELQLQLPQPADAARATPGIPHPEAPDETRLLDALGHDPVTLDALSARSGLTADTLLAMLLALELDGRVAQLPGGLYQQLSGRSG